MSAQDNSIRPVLAATLGIALFAAMDAVMKGGALAIGAYSAFLLRCLMGSVLLAPIWWWRTRVFPRGRVLRIHLVRGTVIAFMGWSFFASLVYLPLAEAIAISFVAPLIALYLARLLLGDLVDRVVLDHPAAQADPVGPSVAPVGRYKDGPGRLLPQPLPHGSAHAYEEAIELFKSLE